MPDRTQDKARRRATVAACTRRWRERQKAKREAAEKVAKIARRAELDAKRAAKGLPPIKSSTERAAECRARQAAAETKVRTESWWSAPALTRLEAEAFLKERHPEETEERIDQLISFSDELCRKHSLIMNKFCLTHGIEAMRIQRAILWQIWNRLDADHDVDRLPEAMRQAEGQEEIQIDKTAHPHAQRQETQTALDFSLSLLGDGRHCRRVELD
jgi:hypothetical protein